MFRSILILIINLMPNLRNVSLLLIVISHLDSGFEMIRIRR